MKNLTVVLCSERKIRRKNDYDDFDMEEEKKFQPASSSKVTPMRHPASRKGGNMEVCVVKPSSVRRFPRNNRDIAFRTHCYPES